MKYFLPVKDQPVRAWWCGMTSWIRTKQFLYVTDTLVTDSHTWCNTAPPALISVTIKTTNYRHGQTSIDTMNLSPAEVTLDR